MDGPTETFVIPEEYLTERRHNLAQSRHFMIIVAGINVAVPFILWLGLTDFHAGRVSFALLPLVLLLAGVMGASMYVGFWLQSRRYRFAQWRQMKLHIGREGIAREAGTVREVVPWERITRVRTFQNPRGEVHSVEVSATGHRPLELFGFAPMSEVAEKITSRVPPTAQVIAEAGSLSPVFRSAAFRYGFLVFILALLAFNVWWFVRFAHTYKGDPYLNIIVGLMLLLNHVAYAFPWRRSLRITFRILSWSGTAFGLFYLLRYSVLPPWVFYWRHGFFPSLLR